MSHLRMALAVVAGCCFLGAVAQGFNKRYDAFGQGHAQGAWGIERTGLGHVVFSVSFEPDTISPDSLIGIYAVILQGIDNNGALQWTKRTKVHRQAVYAGWADCSDALPGGGFVLGGSIEDSSMFSRARLVNYDSSGDTVWTKEFGSPGAFWIGAQVRHTSDGGFLICGVTDSTGSDDGFVIKADGQGNELWRATYSVPGSAVDGLTSIAESIDGDLYMSGSTFPNAEDNQHWFLRTTNTGTVVWEVQWGGPFKEGANYVLLTPEGRVIVAGGSGYAPDDRKPYLAELDTTDGSIIWEQEYGAAYYSTLFFAAKECPNTDIIACGVTYQGGKEQGLLLRTTSAGDSLWMRNYSYFDEVIDSCRGRFWDVLPTDDGGFIAAGFANGPFGGPYPPGYSQDAWVVKVDDMGCVVPGCDATGVAEIVTNLLDALTMYPNPVPQGGPVTVQLALPEGFRKEPLRLSVVSAEGRLVEERDLSPHTSQFTLHISTYASGLYHLHLTRGTTWLSGAKLIVE